MLTVSLLRKVRQFCRTSFHLKPWPLLAVACWSLHFPFVLTCCEIILGHFLYEDVDLCHSSLFMIHEKKNLCICLTAAESLDCKSSRLQLSHQAVRSSVLHEQFSRTTQRVKFSLRFAQWLHGCHQHVRTDASHKSGVHCDRLYESVAHATGKILQRFSFIFLSPSIAEQKGIWHYDFRPSEWNRSSKSYAA